MTKKIALADLMGFLLGGSSCGYIKFGSLELGRPMNAADVQVPLSEAVNHPARSSQA